MISWAGGLHNCFVFRCPKLEQSHALFVENVARPFQMIFQASRGWDQGVVEDRGDAVIVREKDKGSLKDIGWSVLLRSANTRYLHRSIMQTMVFIFPLDRSH